MALASPNPPSKPVRTTVGRFKRSEWLTGYLFILLATVLILIFGLFPIGYALYMSVFRWRIRQGAFIGLDNYADVLGNGWGALAFFGGLLLIMGAHWLWTDAFQRSGEAVGIAFTPHLAVGDDVDSGAFHVADRDQRRVVLRLLKKRLLDTPHLRNAHARHGLRLEDVEIHQPGRLGAGTATPSRPNARDDVRPASGPSSADRPARSRLAG